MFLLFLLFWGIAYFVFKSQFRTTAIIWVSFSIFFFGFGGFSAFLQTLPDTNPNDWIFPAAAASVAMLWGSYALLMYSLHYTGKMPKSKIRQRFVEFLCAVPLISFYFIIPAIQMFGLREPPALQAFHTKVMTGFVTPYFVGSAILLTIHLFRRSIYCMAQRNHHILRFGCSVHDGLLFDSLSDSLFWIQQFMAGQYCDNPC